MAKTKNPKAEKLFQKKLMENEPSFSFQEIQLDLIKYNLYLVFKALCAQAVKGNMAFEDSSNISRLAHRAEELARFLDPKDPKSPKNN